MKIKKFKKGELVYLKYVGAPYEDWEGASCTVVSTKAGLGGQYIEVLPIFSLDGETGLFFPGDVIKEDRPWLKKHLKNIINLRESLQGTARRILEI